MEERQEQDRGLGCGRAGIIGTVGMLIIGGAYALTSLRESVGVRAVTNTGSSVPASVPDNREQQEMAYEGVYFNAGELNNRPSKLVTKMHWYDYPGETMANGEVFDANAYTVATWRYPLGTRLRIKCGTTEIDAVVKDRGPNTVKYPLVQVDATPMVFRKCAPLDVGEADVEVWEIK